MPRAAQSPPPGLQGPAAPRLDAFVAAVRDANPFAANRVTEPSPYDVDVPSIHAASFDRLTALAGRALKDRQGIGAALLGGAGIGKSHLLSRLYRWANGKGESGRPRACYVYLHNILADPDRLPRYLLKYAVSRLSEGGRRPVRETPLYRFAHAAAERALQAVGKKSANVEGVRDALRTYLNPPAEGRDVYEILIQLLRFGHPQNAADPTRVRLANSAVAWLAGDEVDPQDAQALGLKADPQQPAMLRDDLEVAQVFHALARLAEVSGQPLILCADQVDNMDPDKVTALARFLQALLDNGKNLLVIVSGVKQSILEMVENAVIPEASWDRIGQYRIELGRIERQEARHILEARLERFHEPFTTLDPVRRPLREDALFPLGRGWLDARFAGAVEFRPRHVLTWARDAWEEEQARLTKLGGERWLREWPHATPKPQSDEHAAGIGEKSKRIGTVTQKELEAEIDGAVDRKIAEQVAQHRLQPGSLPPDAGNLAGLVESLLEECRGEGLGYTFRKVERMKKRGGKLPPYDVLVRERRKPDGREVTTGVLFITNVGLSATAALKRLLEDENPPDHRLLVTDHERRPLKVGAQGVEYYRDLEKLGRDRFEHLKLDFAQYATLDALREVVGLAKAGDLEIEAPKGTIRPVAEAEVIASHHRKDRYRGQPLLRPLLTEEPAPVAPPPVKKDWKPDEKDVRQFVMAQLAFRMATTAQALAKGYAEVMPAPRRQYEEVWPGLKAVVERMHAEGLVHAQPLDNDLSLLLKK